MGETATTAAAIRNQATLERKAREARLAAEAWERERITAANGLAAVGGALLVVGLWFLLVAPSSGDVDGVAVANFHRLTIGESSAIAGSIFTGFGVLLRYLRAPL